MLFQSENPKAVSNALFKIVNLNLVYVQGNNLTTYHWKCIQFKTEIPFNHSWRYGAIHHHKPSAKYLIWPVLEFIVLYQGTRLGIKSDSLSPVSF